MLTQDYAGPLKELEQRLRSSLTWLGTLDLLIILGAATAISFALDVLFELPWLLRLAAFIGVAVLYWRALRRSRRRLRARISPGDLLTTVESYNPDLEGQLLTAVEFQEALAAGESGLRPLEGHLLERAALEAQQAARKARWRRAIDISPVRRRALAAGGALGLVLLLAGLFPRPFQLWAWRNVFLLTAPWPRQTHFALDGEGGIWHHPCKDPLPISGWVLGKVPRAVSIHIIANGEEKVSRLLPGVARKGTWKLFSRDLAGSESLSPPPSIPPKGQDREFEGRQLAYTLPSVLESFEFYFSGGDNRSKTVRVEVHDRPRFLNTRLILKYPRHSELGEKTIEDPAGEVSALGGTVIELEASLDQPVKEAWIKLGEAGRAPAEKIEGRAFRHSFPLKESCFLEIGASGGDWGFEAQSAHLALAALPDHSPQVTLEIEGDNRLVTPQGKIAYRVEAADDFGLRGLELKAAKSGSAGPSGPAEPAGASGSGESSGEAAAERIDLSPWTAEKSEPGVRVRVERSLELAPLGLEAGTRLTLQAAATDNDEPAGFKTAYSNRETFLVMNPEELREEMDKRRVEAQARLEELAHREERLAEGVKDFSAGKESSAQPASEPPPPAPAQEEAQAQAPSTSSSPSTSPTPSPSRPDATAQASQGSQTAQASSSVQNSQNAQAPQAEQAPQTAQASQAAQASRTAQASRSAPPQDSSRSSPEAAGPREPTNRLAGEQKSVAQEAQKVSRRLEEMKRILKANQLLDRNEERRFDAEIARPLEELAQERLPQSAENLDALPRSPNPQADRQEARQEVEKIARQMKEVAARLGESKNFGEVLQRLEMIIDLHGKVMEETGKGVEQKQNKK